MLASGVNSISQAGPAGPAGFEALGKDEFLKLFITKLRNQDPLAPANDEQFIAQLAQFSALEQSIQSNGLLTRIVDGQDVTAQSRLMELLGRQVVVKGDIPLHVASGVPESLSVNLGAGASSVTVEILDGSGNVVRTIGMGPRPEGVSGVAWDGRDDRGQSVSDGAYTYRVQALDQRGGQVSAEALLTIRIDSLSVVGGAVVPLSQGRVVDLSNIQEITL